MENQAVVLTDGLTPVDEEEGEGIRWKHIGGSYGHWVDRQKNLPIKTFELGFKAKLEDGKATEKYAPLLGTLRRQPPTPISKFVGLALAAGVSPA